ncbi:hypothetical protein JD844_024781, partial [Phrynosoma platyrhinos]
TNWVGQILTDLVNTSAKQTEDFNSLDDEKLEEFPYLEVGDAEKYQILLLIRNPKDVATSFYHFSNGLSPLPSYKTFDDFFTAFMNGKMPWGSYFDYVFEWNKHADKKNLMTVTYEELKENHSTSRTEKEEKYKKMAYIRKKFIETLEKAMEKGAKMTREEMLFTYDGIVYPTTLCSSEVFKALESFEARSDDVILGGYCKSGTNWVGQVITDLVITSAKKHEPHKLNEELLLAEFPYLEIGDPEKYQVITCTLYRNPKNCPDLIVNG